MLTAVHACRSFKRCRIKANENGRKVIVVPARVLSSQIELDQNHLAFVHMAVAAPNPRASPSPQRASSQAGGSSSSLPVQAVAVQSGAQGSGASPVPPVLPLGPAQPNFQFPLDTDAPPAAAPSDPGMDVIDEFEWNHPSHGQASSSASGAGPSMVLALGPDETTQNLQNQIDELREETKSYKQRIEELERTVQELLAERAGHA